MPSVLDGQEEIIKLIGMSVPLLMTLARFDVYKWGPDKSIVQIFGDALRRLLPQLKVVLDMWPSIKPVLEAGNISNDVVSNIAALPATVKEKK